MKISGKVLVALAVLALLLGGCSFSKSLAARGEPVDRGTYDPQGIGGELASLEIGGGLSIVSIDGKSVLWTNIGRAPQYVKLPLGSYLLELKYSDDKVFTPKAYRASVHLGSEGTYKLVGTVGEYSIDYSLIEEASGENVLKTPMASILSYVSLVLDHSSKEVGKQVRLDSEDYELILKPDLEFTLTEKATGIVREGRQTFLIATNPVQEATAYFVDLDPANMSSDEFLNNYAYKALAEDIWKIVYANDSLVTYQVQRTASLGVAKITFTFVEAF